MIRVRLRKVMKEGDLSLNPKTGALHSHSL